MREFAGWWRFMWSIAWLGLALTAPAGAQLNPYVETDAPKPTAAVQTILDDAARLAKDKKWDEVLGTALRALNAAKEAKDFPGEASAYRIRAQALSGQNHGAEAVD